MNPVIKFVNDAIEGVNNCKYLGVYLDDYLKYQDQMNHIKSKLRQMRGISYSLRNYLDRKRAKKVYYSMVYSTVAYCITIWGSIFCCSIDYILFGQILDYLVEIILILPN